MEIKMQQWQWNIVKEVLYDYLDEYDHQEELFEKQDAMAKLLCEYANEGSSIANRMVNLLPNTFRQEKI